MTTERLADFTCVGFAVWTLLCHVAVATGAGLRDLLVATGVLMPSSLVLFYGWRLAVRSPRLRSTLPSKDLSSLGTSVGDSSSPSSGSLLVVALGLMAVVLTLSAQRPDEDDSFYLSMAVAAADFPDRPLLYFDGLHNIPGALIHHPAYRLHSLELLAGALTYLTGIASIYWSHLLVAGVAAFFLPLVYSRLLKHLAPRRWRSCLVVVLLIFLAVGDPHQWYSNFGFVRLHQGKAILATVLVPLMTCYAIEFSGSPRLSGWLRLAASQVAAVGVSATGLWLGPAVVGLGLVTCWRPRALSSKVLLLGILTSAYPLTAALEVRSEVAERAAQTRMVEAANESRDSRPAIKTPGPFVPTPGASSDRALWQVAREAVLGEGWLLLVVSAACLLAWLSVKEPVGRRFSVVYLFGFLLLFNPIADDVVARTITGEAAYWRVFWILPAPTLLALFLTAPLSRVWPSRPETASSSRSRSRFAATVLLVAAFGVLVPRFSVLDHRNRETVLGSIRLNVPWQYSYARRIVDLAPAGATVLAPLEISPWITTLHHHPTPIVTRSGYTRILRRDLGAAEAQERLALAVLVSRARKKPSSVEALLTAVDRYGLGLVCLNSKIRWNANLARELETRGFHNRFEDTNFQIWVRARGAPSVDQAGDSGSARRSPSSQLTMPAVIPAPRATARSIANGM